MCSENARRGESFWKEMQMCWGLIDLLGVNRNVKKVTIDCELWTNLITSQVSNNSVYYQLGEYRWNLVLFLFANPRITRDVSTLLQSQSDTRQVIVLDDNMYYRSMRCLTCTRHIWGLRTLVHVASVFFPPCLKRILEMNDSFPRTMKSHGFGDPVWFLNVSPLENTLKFSCFSLLSQGKQWYHLCREHHCSYHQLFLQALGTSAPTSQPDDPGKSLEDYPTKNAWNVILRNLKPKRGTWLERWTFFGGEDSGSVSPNG